MKHLRIYEEFQTEAEDLTNTIREYLITEYPADWWENEFQSRLYDYIDDDDCIGYGSEEEPDYESPEEAYRNLCSGGAIEYDLIGEISKDIKDKFNLTDDEYNKINVGDLVENQMVNMIDWYDHTIFGESKRDPSDPFGLNKGVRDLMSRYDKYDKTEDGNYITKSGLKF